MIRRAKNVVYILPYPVHIISNLSIVDVRGQEIISSLFYQQSGSFYCMYSDLLVFPVSYCMYCALVEFSKKAVGSRKMETYR